MFKLLRNICVECTNVETKERVYRGVRAGYLLYRLRAKGRRPRDVGTADLAAGKLASTRV